MYKFSPEKLAAFLEMALEKRKISAVEAAEKIGVSRSSLLRAIDQSRTPDMATLLTFADWLEVHPKHFFEQSEQEDNQHQITEEIENSALDPKIKSALITLIEMAYYQGPSS